MGPPQVNLNEKPPAEVSQGSEDWRAEVIKEAARLSALTDRYNDVADDPLPEKNDTEEHDAIIVTVDRPLRRCGGLTPEQTRQRRRCRIGCCASLSFLLVLLLALGTACLVYRMKHKRVDNWRSFCGTKEGLRVPEHVKVDPENQLIYVKPEHNNKHAMETLHEYNRHLIAFKNSTAKICYLDRLDETFEDGYARWQGYVETEHVQNHTLRVFAQKVDVEVVQHIADIHIFEHCGGVEYEYHWVKSVTMEEVRMHPAETYITV